jgi:ABC-type Fe3+-hydroxamate transport system substrate-binding protein
MAGGFSLNREQDFQESENAEYTVEAFNTLDPDIILVAGNFAPFAEDFFRICHELNITCSAISHGKVRIMDSKYISGPLSWIISLMDVANLLHPEIFQYSLEKEKIQLDMVIAENSVF